MDKDNNKFRFLNIPQYFKSEETKKIDETGLISEIRTIDPLITFMVICHSEINDLKFLLEGAGLFAEMRISREHRIVTNGKQIKLDETQRALLYTVSKPENIEKIVIVKGPQGSGKTILSVEVLKMKLSHYIRKFNLGAIMGKFIIKVFVCGCYNGSNKVVVLLKQLMEETKDISDFCDLQFKALPDFKITNVGDFVLKISELEPQDDHSIQQTILFIDELFPAFHSSEWQGLKIEELDFVLSIRHAFHDGMFQSSSNPQSINQGIDVEENVVYCQLTKPYRSTKQLIDFMYYWLIHSPQEDEFYKQKSFVHSKGCIDGPTPLWIEVPIVEVFIEYANSDEQLKDAKDVLVLFDMDYNATSIHTLRRHCLNKKWKFYSENEVMGSEAQIVIIYDTKKIHFESLSRAVCQLIIVTTTNTKKVGPTADFDSDTGTSVSSQSRVNPGSKHGGLPENWEMRALQSGKVSFLRSLHFQKTQFLTVFVVFSITLSIIGIKQQHGMILEFHQI